MNLKDHIRAVPDFPKPGILFYDISTLLAHPEAWNETVRQLKTALTPYHPSVLVGIESRGFLVAAPLAYALGCGFVMVRKRGKLPGATIPYTYDLEYGTDCLEIHEDALRPGDRALVVDDVIATGGTAAAAGHLVRQLGAELAGYAFLLELTFLKGREKLQGNVFSLIRY